MSAVGSDERPGDCLPLRVGGAEGVEDGVPVLGLGERGPAGGDNGRLVHVGNRDHLHLLQGAGVSAVRRPNGHLVDVVPVGVGRPLVVGGEPESQFAQAYERKEELFAQYLEQRRGIEVAAEEFKEAQCWGEV